MTTSRAWSTTFGLAAARRAGSLLVVGLALLTVTCTGEDWPQWRGPNQDGISPEGSGWPDAWPPKERWRTNVGLGCTSPVIVDGRLYVMGWHGPGDGRRPHGNPEGEDVLLCLEANTGKRLWSTRYASRYQSRRRAGDLGAYGGPAATPVVAPEGTMIVTLGIDGHLQCRDLENAGRLVWAHNLYDEYNVPPRPDVGGGRRDFGFVTSPLILNQIVYVNLGAEETTVVGLDLGDGAEVWRSKKGGPAGHVAGLTSMTGDKEPRLGVLTLTELNVITCGRANPGPTLKSHPWQTDFGCNLAMPVVTPNGMILTSAYNRKQTALLDVEREPIREQWSTREHSLLSTPVVHRGRVYMTGGALTCLDLATGKLRWKGRLFNHGTCLVTAADSKLIVFGSRRLALVDADPETNEYRELTRIDTVVPDRCYPHLALADGILVCKDRAGNMVAFSLARPDRD